MPRQTYRLRDYQTTSFERSLAGFALPPDSPMLPLLPSALIVLAMALLFSRFRRSTGFRAVFDLRCKINPLYVMAGSGLPGLIFCSVWP